MNSRKTFEKSYYDITGKRYAIIFNQDATEDSREIEGVLKGLDFVVDSHPNMNKASIMNKLSNVDTNISILVVIVLTTGDGKINLYDSNNLMYRMDELWLNVHNLIDIPKLFFIQALPHKTGSTEIDGALWSPPVPQMNSGEYLRFSTERHFLQMFTQFKPVKLFNDDDVRYIQDLSKVLKSKSQVMDINMILTCVQSRITFVNCTPQVVSTLTKLLKF